MSQFSDLHSSERGALRRNSVLARPWGNLVYGADEPGLGEDAVALLDHLEIETADIVGHSLGGMAALSLLEHHSGRVARAILIEGWTALSFGRVVAKDILERLDPTDAQAVAEKRRHTIDRWDPTVHEQFWRTVAAADATTVLSRTATPVLEIYGDRDRPRPTGEQFGVPDRPAVKLAWIAGAGHYPHLSHPDLVAELLRSFLE